jgi:hypothetical protein
MCLLTHLFVGQVQLQTRLHEAVKHEMDADIILTDMSSKGPPFSRNLKLVGWLTGARMGGADLLQETLPGGVPPASIRYAPAVGIRRLWIFLSAGVVQSRSHAVKILKEAAQKPFSQWTVFANQRPKPAWVRKRPSQVYEVFTDEQFAAMDSEPKYAIAWSKFLLGLARPGPRHATSEPSGPRHATSLPEICYLPGVHGFKRAKTCDESARKRTT